MDREVLTMPARTDEPELLMPGEVAALFGVKPVTVKRWALAGKLTPVKTPGGWRRYRADEVLALRERGPDSLELLTRAQVAQLLQVPPKRITRWAKVGKLTPVDTLGGHHRYRADQVRALVATSQSEAAR
jgi:predicted site-specific integrase-resolvase